MNERETKEREKVRERTEMFKNEIEKCEKERRRERER